MTDPCKSQKLWRRYVAIIRGQTVCKKKKEEEEIMQNKQKLPRRGL